MPGCPLGADPVGFYRDLRAAAPAVAPSRSGRRRHDPGDGGRSLHGLVAVPLGPDLHPRLLPRPGRGRRGQRCAAPFGGSRVGRRPQRGVARRPALDDHLQRRGRAPRCAATAALARSLAARYPLGGAEAVANYLVACPGWTGSDGAIAHLAPNGVPTPLVIGNVYDPNTPYVVAPQLAAAIGGRLGHVRRLRAHLAAQRIDQRLHGRTGDGVLRQRVVPAKGTRCRTSSVSRKQMYMPPLTPIS